MDDLRTGTHVPYMEKPGSLSKKVIGGARSSSGISRSGSGGLLTSPLDGDRDGSIRDDVLAMVARTMLR